MICCGTGASAWVGQVGARCALTGRFTVEKGRRLTGQCATACAHPVCCRIPGLPHDSLNRLACAPSGEGACRYGFGSSFSLAAHFLHFDSSRSTSNSLRPRTTTKYPPAVPRDRQRGAPDFPTWYLLMFCSRWFVVESSVTASLEAARLDLSVTASDVRCRPDAVGCCLGTARPYVAWV